MNKYAKKSGKFILSATMLYLVLLIPGKEKSMPIQPSGEHPFLWNQDATWLQLEDEFRYAKQQTISLQDSMIHLKVEKAEALLSLLEKTAFKNDDSLLLRAEKNFYNLAAWMAVRPETISWYASYYNRLRNLIKQQSCNWNMLDNPERNTVYRVLYGMRAAYEEVLLQAEQYPVPEVLLVNDVKSEKKSVELFGISVQSGDVLVSRGGATVSALISRGNDYPGNFSHVALLYVEEESGTPYLIEAHIEKGLAISSAEQYIKDRKLRFMVLRPRADLPALIKEPSIPQKAAQYMFNKSEQKHIPYDFKMNFRDSSEMFCSEVASFAYGKFGLQLWKSSSHISSTGLVNWLHDFGVENFVTQMPSDLEYDPQLYVVAEYRNRETLYKDHLDNAVMDALLEQANKGKAIGYPLWKLPFVRGVKGYCVLKNIIGFTGAIPEGMSAVAALKNQRLDELHQNAKEKLLTMSDDFILKNHYRPPYWQLVSFARTAVNNMEL